MNIIKKSVFIVSIFIISSFAYCGSTPYDSKAAYIKATKFSPGIISTSERFELNAVFNKAGDKVIFTRCQKGFKECTLMESTFNNNVWESAKALPFSGNYADADPYFSPDYAELYFISKRPINIDGDEAKSLNLWKVSYTNHTWGDPEYLENLSSTEDDLYPSLSQNGDLYFPTTRNKKRSLYVAKATKDGFSEPVAIPSSVYGENASIGDSVISRDGNTIIFSIWSRKDSKGEGDLYISHKVNNHWTNAKSLGDLVNTEHSEFTPIMSPNNEYLFFTRVENGLGNIYQIHKSLLKWD